MSPRKTASRGSTRSWVVTIAVLAGLSAIAMVAPPAASGCASFRSECYAGNPCCDGLSCHPGIHRCYHNPRRTGEPCAAGIPCRSGLTCEAGSQVCQRPGSLGEPCHLTQPCGAGLSCQPGENKCYRHPRWPRDPCDASHGCQVGFQCQSGGCVPGRLDAYRGNWPCNQLRVDDLAEFAVSSGRTMTYSFGQSRGDGTLSTIEHGTVYDTAGNFGCFVTLCTGVKTDVPIDYFTNFGFLSVTYDRQGWSTTNRSGVIWATTEKPRSPTEVAREHRIGAFMTLSLDSNLTPAHLEMAVCSTEMIDGSQALSDLTDSEMWARRRSRAYPRRAPARLLTAPAPMLCRAGSPGTTTATRPGNQPHWPVYAATSNQPSRHAASRPSCTMASTGAVALSGSGRTRSICARGPPMPERRSVAFSSRSAAASLGRAQSPSAADNNGRTSGKRHKGKHTHRRLA